MDHNIKSLAFIIKSMIRRPRTIAAYYRFQKNQYLSPDELYELNWKKRKRLLYYAYNRVPFYRKRFSEQGIHPEDIKNPDDFTMIPFLTKQDVRENTASLISSDALPGHLQVSTTGGSTGIPLKVFHDSRFPQDALGWRMMNWWGVRTGMDEAIVWRFVPGINDDNGWYSRTFRGWPTKRIYIDASSMSNQDIARFVRNFNRVRPSILRGYAGGVDHVASFIEKNNIDIYSPKVIFLTSSPISSVQRQQVERVFRAPVYDQYGSGEVYWMASQCREGGALHIYFDSRHIEFINNEGLPCPVGTLGEITVTDLDNYAFPLIRYMNGDMGRALDGLCPCGVNLPMMDQVKGRVSDHIKTPDGTCLVGDYLTTIFDEFPEAVRQFQVYQNTDFSVFLYVVINHHFSGITNVLEIVKENLNKKTKGQVPIKIVPVEEVPSERGKTRYVISEVN